MARNHYYNFCASTTEVELLGEADNTAIVAAETMYNNVK